jgi:hypothetical protein
MTGVEKFDWRDCVGQYRLYYLVRSLHVLAMLLCGITIAARVVAAALAIEAATFYDEAAAACNAEGTDTRSAADREIWNVAKSTSDGKTGEAVSASRVIEAAVLVLTAGAFLLFFPACIVMFRRVERRLDAIIRQMNHRSDLGTVFLPYEFSPPAADGARSQVEMQVVEARAFLSRMKSAAATQEMQFSVCLLLALAALAVQASFAVFTANSSFNSEKNPACYDCESCQSVKYLMRAWNLFSPHVTRLVSTCLTLPLMFSLWLMMTKEDRALMLNPGRFRTDAILLQPVKDRTTASLKSHSVRMGIELR